MFDDSKVIEECLKEKLSVSMLVYRFHAREVSSGLYRVFDIPVDGVNQFLRDYFRVDCHPGFILEIEGLHVVDL